ncbi:hypothetical protein [Opitutus sp. ER46]|uniref:hypothetical protein n=1 Tax=Opitutus sp. ER46 TaxID=2161864 RepID=UPI000D32565F|nr:hypothetical protein [Opitutus sp. ER46]PTX95735.1 hypothetical protein DB354_10010 [Opitutus sp. ER46]
MVEALELPLKLPEPEIRPEQIEQLVGVLSKAEEHRASLPSAGRRKPSAGWLTAIEIATVMGDDTTDRDVRAIASAACPVVVSYPGSPGYKLWSLCTVAEIDHCIDAFEAQARDMMKRAVLYRQAYHRRFRGAPASDGRF